MTASFTGSYFDSESLRSRPVEMHLADGRLHITGIEPAETFSVAEIKVSDRLGRVPRYLYMPGRKTIETDAQDAADQLAALQKRGQLSAVVNWLEERARVAAAAAFVLVTSIALVLYFGLPTLARRTAYAVPESLEQESGKAALSTINRFLGPTKLSRAERTRIQGLLDRLGHQPTGSRRLRIEFRSLGEKSPNAFALPGGIIIMSDEIIALAGNDAEILAILAHELGHVEKRHTLQTVLRSSVALLVVSTITGDLSTLTSFSGTIPFVLLQRGYSREFEREADDYAVAMLKAANLDAESFMAILEKLEKAHTGDSQDYSYLGTHPSTEDRIKRLRETRRTVPAH